MKKISEQGSLVVAARPLKDETWAVGLFNRGDAAAKMSVAWSDLGLHGKLSVRDLWAHKDLGKVADQFSADVPAHGVVLITVKRIEPGYGARDKGHGLRHTKLQSMKVSHSI